MGSPRPIVVPSRVAVLLALLAPVAAIAADGLPASVAVAQATHDALGRDLGGLLAYARERSPDLAAMRFDAEAAAERVAPAGALPDPMLQTELRDVTNEAAGTGASLLPSKIGSTRYLLTQELPAWGKRDLRTRQAAAEASAAQAQTLATWAELAGRVKIAYAQYYGAARSLALTREILDLLGRLEDIARVRYAGGLAPQQDVLRAQLEQTALRGELASLEAERAGLAANLNGLLARPARAALADPAALPPLPDEAALDAERLEQRLREANPQLRVEGARLAAAERGRELTYRNRYSDFRLGLGAVQMGSRVAEWELMLELNIPLQQDSRRAQEREAEALVAAARARQEAAGSQLSGELGRSLAALTTARRLAALSATSLLPQAELTLQAALAGYEAGKVDFATVLEGQRQIRQARLNELRAQVEARVQLADIERILGDSL